jgi:hypothetical protein
MANTRFALQQSVTEVLEKERRTGSLLRSFYHKARGPCVRSHLLAAMFPAFGLGCPGFLGTFCFSATSPSPNDTKRFAAYRDLN